MKKIVFSALLCSLSFLNAGLWDIGRSVKKDKEVREKAMIDSQTTLEKTQALVDKANEAMLAEQKTLETLQETLAVQEKNYQETKKFIAHVDQELAKNSALVAEQDALIAKAEKMIKKAQAFIEHEQKKIQQATAAKQAPKEALERAQKQQHEDNYQSLSDQERLLQEERQKIIVHRELYHQAVKNYEEKKAANTHAKKRFNASIDACKEGLPCSLKVPNKVD